MIAPGAACLGLDAFTATAQAQSLVGGTEIPQAAWHGQNLKKNDSTRLCGTYTVPGTIHTMCVCLMCVHAQAHPILRATS